MIIVSRHPGAVEWLRKRFPELADAPVKESVTAEDVRGEVVVGNIPFDLAAEAAVVWAISFAGDPPRGREFTAEDMEKAGADVAPYKVRRVDMTDPMAEMRAWDIGIQVERSATGNYRIPTYATEFTIEDRRQSGGSYDKSMVIWTEPLKGWEPWEAVVAVRGAAGTVWYYFVRRREGKA